MSEKFREILWLNKLVEFIERNDNGKDIFIIFENQVFVSQKIQVVFFQLRREPNLELLLTVQFLINFLDVLLNYFVTILMSLFRFNKLILKRVDFDFDFFGLKKVLEIESVSFHDIFLFFNM